MAEISSPECVAEGELCALLGEVVEFCAHAGVGGGVEFARRPLNGVTIQPGDTLSIFVRNLDDSGNVVRGSSKIFQSSFTDDHPVEPIANGIEICDLANPFHLAAAVPVPEVEEEEAEAELVGGL